MDTTVTGVDTAVTESPDVTKAALRFSYVIDETIDSVCSLGTTTSVVTALDAESSRRLDVSVGGIAVIDVMVTLERSTLSMSARSSTNLARM